MQQLAARPSAASRSTARASSGTCHLPLGLAPATSSSRAAATIRQQCRAIKDNAPSTEVAESSTSAPPAASTSTSDVDLGKELSKFTRTTAATFAPRSSTAQKNPAFRGSTLYNIFEVQAWLSVAVGGLLSFNLLYPTDGPDIPRLLGMWSIWMFTIPSLRARECTAKEKDALNLLFIAVPLMNVALPFVWKSFGFIFSADVLAVAGIYWWKGVWEEVYGIPFGYTPSDEAKP